MDINSIEPNSNKYRQEKLKEKYEQGLSDGAGGLVPKKKREKVVLGGATIKKKSLTKRFVETFFAGNVTDVKSYLIFDVLFPAIKETIASMITKGSEMILFGEPSHASRKRTGDTTYISYGSSYRNEKERRTPSIQNRMARRFDDIKLDSREDAERIVGALEEIMDIYKQVTIGDLYDAVGITPEWSDRAEEYGWADLNGIHVSRVRDGYILEMPKCIKL